MTILTPMIFDYYFIIPMKNNPIIAEVPIPIHQGTNQKGNLRRLQRKVISQPLDISLTKDEKLKMLMIGCKNKSFLKVNPTPQKHKRSISTECQSKREKNIEHFQRRKESLQIPFEKPKNSTQDGFDINIFHIEKLNRSFVNGVLNKRNKSFRIKQRH